MRLNMFAFGLAGILMAPTIAAAQTCMGLPSFSGGPVNARVGYAAADEVSQLSAGVQLGGRSTFAGVAATRTSYDGVDEKGMGLSANAGTQIPVGAARRTAVCPYVEVGLGFGPDFQEGEYSLKYRQRAVMGGLSIGGSLDAGDNLRIIPNAGVGVVWGGTKISFSSSSFDYEEDGTSTYGVINGGIGLLFSRTVAITPYVAVPVGVDGAEPTYGVYASIAFGSR